MTGFDMHVDYSRQVCRFTLAGEIDLGVSDELAAAGLACLESEARVLSVDLGQVTFIDSTGIGALIKIRNRAELLGKTLHVARVSDRVAKVLTIAGLAAVFGVAPSEITEIESAEAPGSMTA